MLYLGVPRVRALSIVWIFKDHTKFTHLFSN